MPKEKKKEIKTLGKIVLAPKEEPKKPTPIKRNLPVKKEAVQIQQQSEPAQFKKIALEELMNKDISNQDLGQGARWIRRGGEEKEEKKEAAIYDLAKMSNGPSYDPTGSYDSVVSKGDYSMAASQPATFVDPNQQQNRGVVGGGGTFNPTANQAQSYDTAGEKNLKKERDRRGGMW